MERFRKRENEIRRNEDNKWLKRLKEDEAKEGTTFGGDNCTIVLTRI